MTEKKSTDNKKSAGRKPSEPKGRRLKDSATGRQLWIPSRKS